MHAPSLHSDVAAQRSGQRAYRGARIRSGLALGLWAVLGAASPASAQAPPTETLLPLGPAQVSQVQGEAWAISASPRRPLQVGDRVGDGQQVQTAGPARLELRFADGTLLRVDGGTALTLLPQVRRVALHRGRVLVAADRMLGGLAVLLRQVALLPEGTTYLAAASDAGGELTVLEGAVCACTVAPAEAHPAAVSPGNAAAAVRPATATTAPRPAVPATATSRPTVPAPTTPRPAAPETATSRSAASVTLPPTREQMVLPGESFSIAPPGPAPGPAIGSQRLPPSRLAELLKSEPLITGFTQPLPSLRQITDLADQQRRGVLAGRNERLRREIFWKRKPRPPLKLPALFNEPDSVIIRYFYPE